MRKNGFSLVELLVAVGIIMILAGITVSAALKAYESASLAVSATNLRQLGVGASAYLADHNSVFWKYRQEVAGGTVWWFGFETTESSKRPEGQRVFDPQRGPLAGYVPAGFRADPSFALAGKTFKPKFKNGYIGVGYNVLLGSGWLDLEEPEIPLKNVLHLSNPNQVVVFATSAQVNVFQKPASTKNPMLEEFYGFDEGANNQASIHFRHRGYAMVSFANGSAGFLPMDETTRDKRMPEANVGRFAPAGSKKYLE